MPSSRTTRILWLAAFACLIPNHLQAQAGTPREIPGLEIEHGWKNRLEPRLEAMAEPAGPRRSAAVAEASGVSGTLRLPLVFVEFPTSRLDECAGMSSGQCDQRKRDVMQSIAERIGGQPGGLLSVSQYYHDMSGGRLNVEVAVPNRTIMMPKSSAYYVGNRAIGGVAQHLDEFISDVTSRAYEIFDWRLFDNDGADDIPNSGDDDGRVDAMILVFATQDGACHAGNNSGLWSHRWTLENPNLLGRPFETGSIARNGQPVLLSDYVAVPVYACHDTSHPGGLAPNGTLIHEIGHVLGLPDLYDTARPYVSGTEANVGHWDLMGMGNWLTPEYPAAMGAWSRSVLGWVEQIEVTDSHDLRILPVHDTRTVVRVDSRDSEDFLLLEYRTIRPERADHALPGEGLLVWQVDPKAVAERAPSNRVNNYPAHPGIALRAADGSNPTGSDAGDPWPGSANRTSFSLLSTPRAQTLDGKKSLGVRLDDIRLQGDTVLLDVTQGAVRMTPVRIVSEIPRTWIVIDDTLEVASPYEGFLPTGAMISVEIRGEDNLSSRIKFGGWNDNVPSRVRAITLDSREMVDIVAAGYWEHRVSVQSESPSLGTVSLWRGATRIASSAWVKEGMELTLKSAAVQGARFLFWDAGPEADPDTSAGIARWAHTKDLIVEGPHDLFGVFSPQLESGESIDQALTGHASPLPEAMHRYLDLLGNRNGRLDIGDLVLGLKEKRLHIVDDGIHFDLGILVP